MSKPFSKDKSWTQRLDVERYSELKRATEELKRIRSKPDMEVGIILEHDEEGYRIDKDSMSNPSLKGSVQQRWSNELLSLIAELVQEKKHIYWKAFDDPVEAGFQVEQSSLNEYQE